MKTITLYCVNNEVYFPTKKEAKENMVRGDTLSKIAIEYDELRELIADLLNLESVISEEIEVK